MKSYLLLFFIGAMLLFSCLSEPDCIQTSSSFIKLDFKQTKINPTTLLKTVVDTALIFDYVKISGIKDPYISYTANQTFSSLTLPIDPNKSTITYYLNRRSKSGAISRLDSIQFEFSNQSRVISAKCGAYMYFLDLKITQTNLNETSYKIVNTNLLKNTTNVQIYF